METKTIKKVKIESKVSTLTHKLILHNDCYNDMLWIVNCLMDICKHSIEQAEQCMSIAHQKGQCEVKLGSKSVLREMQIELALRQIDSTIEEN